MLVQKIESWLQNNRIWVAKLIFSLDAVLGILSIGGAALFGAAYSSGNVWTTALAIFVPCALLWGAFCYGAYRGLTSGHLALKCLFWIFVAGNFFGFPVGTAIAALSIWLWRDGRKGNTRPHAR
jgi:hypothetical protein